MLKTPFFTDLDSRAAVKGSRDPLGLLALWTRLGRHVIGNLTMASSSLRDFTVTMLGYHFVEQLSETLGAGSAVDTFLKWEQLSAYSRAHINRDFGFRGTDRVRRQLEESYRVTISADRAHQLLGNQKIYGLWALYSGPSRTSALLGGDPVRLTPPARQLVDEFYLPLLEAGGAGKDAKRIVEILAKSSALVDVEGRDKQLATSIAACLKPKLFGTERSFYLRHLVDGGPSETTDGRQPRLADLLNETLTSDGFTWSPGMVGHLAKRARRQGADWHALAYRLDRIRSAETVFAPSSLLFSYLLGKDGQKLVDVAADLRKQWGAGVSSVDLAGFEELRDELGADSKDVAARWIAISKAFKGGDYETLVQLLATQNQEVMKDRGGLAWLDIANKKLVVRFRDEQGWLPSREQLPTLWRFPYFLESLRQISGACGGTQRNVQ